MAAPDLPARSAARVVDTAAGLMLVEATSAGLARVEQVDADELGGVGMGGGEMGGGGPAASRFNVKHLDDDDDDGAGGRDAGGAAGHLDRVADQLRAYCAGELREFDVPVDWAAAGVHDEFSREVYREIQRIPYGETSTYGQISMDAGRPRNARRVGRLCTLVPVAFVIPVHRVIRADGSMGNCPEYRLRLLEHERRNVAAAKSGSRMPIAFV